MEVTCRFTYTNSSPAPVILVLEPWAEEYVLAPGARVAVVGEGVYPGQNVELEHMDGRLIIYAWQGSAASFVEL